MTDHGFAFLHARIREQAPGTQPRPASLAGPMQWGQEHWAGYQLLQAQPGRPADLLDRSEGLTDLGLVCTSTT
jgi:hypothetical protein